MWVKFEPQLDWQVVACLSSTVSRDLGVELWQISQNNQHYCIKLLKNKAAFPSQKSYQHELDFYQKRQGSGENFEDMILNSQIFSISEFAFKHHHLLNDVYPQVLILPYVTPLNMVLVHQENFDIKVQMNWFRQILKLIKDLKILGYLHGDLKPQNFVVQQNQIKLIDFAQIQKITEHRTVVEQGGTPAYMAPELFLGKRKTIQSEIYALGVIFYQLLTNQKPFTAQTYQQWAVQHCQKHIPLLPNDFRHYQNLVDRMLAKRIENRFLGLQDIENELNLIEYL